MGDFGAIAVALVSAAGFLGAGLLLFSGIEAASGLRPYAAPVAAGILIALAFGDVFPEALEASAPRAILGFAIAFSLLYLVETLTHSAGHDAVHAPARMHELVAMVSGLAVHNIADGVALGAGGELSGATASLLGLGVLIHQVPVGLSFAALLISIGIPRSQATPALAGMALLIPLATALTRLLPVGSPAALGTLLGASAGLLVYIGAAHLLPEVEANRHNRNAALAFVATLLAMTIVSVTFLGHA